MDSSREGKGSQMSLFKGKGKKFDQMNQYSGCRITTPGQESLNCTLESKRGKSRESGNHLLSHQGGGKANKTPKKADSVGNSSNLTIKARPIHWEMGI